MRLNLTRKQEKCVQVKLLKINHMHYWNSPYLEWQKEVPNQWDIYVCRVRTSRNKALLCAVFELLSLLAQCDPIPLLVGPLADQKGVYRISVAKRFREKIKGLLNQSGYTSHVYRVAELDEVTDTNELPDTNELTDTDAPNVTRWRKKEYALLPVYSEEQHFLRDRAPDKRMFLLQKSDGEITPVLGYRGDGNQGSRRGLPPEDARMMVNVAKHRESPQSHKFLVDPFAGVGGIVFEATSTNSIVFSGDIDPKLQYGLSHMTDQRHANLDALHLPFRGNIFSAVVSELPFNRSFLNKQNSYQLARELSRVVVDQGRIVLMTSIEQANLLKTHFSNLDIQLKFESYINRKGTDVYVCVWQKG